MLPRSAIEESFSCVIYLRSWGWYHVLISSSLSFYTYLAWGNELLMGCSCFGVMCVSSVPMISLFMHVLEKMSYMIDFSHVVVHWLWVAYKLILSMNCRKAPRENVEHAFCLEKVGPPWTWEILKYHTYCHRSIQFAKLKKYWSCKFTYIF